MVQHNLPPTVPTYDDLLWPTLVALKAMGGSASNDELLAKVIELEQIPEQTAIVLHTDTRQTKLGYNLAWAKSYLKRVGAVDNSARGVWSITAEGEAFTREDASRVPATVRRQDYDAKRRGELQDVLLPSATDDSIPIRQSPPEEMWKDKLLSCLRGLAPDAFERLAQRLLREAGFIKVEVTGRSGDGGIDGIGVLRINLLSFQVLFQCKRYQGSVGSGTIRDFRGAMVGRSDKGLMITTGTFSGDARKEATRDGAPAIELIEGDTLCDLLKSLKLGVSTQMVESVLIDPEWFAKV